MPVYRFSVSLPPADSNYGFHEKCIPPSVFLCRSNHKSSGSEPPLRSPVRLPGIRNSGKNPAVLPQMHRKTTSVPEFSHWVHSSLLQKIWLLSRYHAALSSFPVHNETDTPKHFRCIFLCEKQTMPPHIRQVLRHVRTVRSAHPSGAAIFWLPQNTVYTVRSTDMPSHNSPAVSGNAVRSPSVPPSDVLQQTPADIHPMPAHHRHQNKPAPALPLFYAAASAPRHRMPQVLPYALTLRKT